MDGVNATTIELCRIWWGNGKPECVTYNNEPDYNWYNQNQERNPTRSLALSNKCSTWPSTLYHLFEIVQRHDIYTTEEFYQSSSLYGWPQIICSSQEHSIGRHHLVGRQVIYFNLTHRYSDVQKIPVVAWYLALGHERLRGST